MLNRPLHTRVVRTAVAGGAALAFSAVGLLGYVTSGHKWPTRVVPYYVNTQNLDVTDSEAEAAVRAGADAWAAQSDANFAFAYAGRTAGSSLTNNGKNEVFFRNDSGGSVAATYSWWNGAGDLVDADIVFYDGAYKFFTGTSGCASGVYIEDFATHEFGHVLGLKHTGVTGATMTSSTGWCSQNWRTLELDDIDGVETLYPPGASTSSPPSAPTGATASVSSTNPTGTINVKWTDTSSSEDRFLVERSRDAAAWTQVASVAANVTTYANSGLTAGTTYLYRVRASNASGFSGYSNTASATTSTASLATATAPSAPTAPSPANGATSVATNVTLSWSATGATTYDVYLGKTSSPALYKSGLQQPSLAVSLSGATKYYWRVVAKNTAGSKSGSTWSFTTRPGSSKK